MGICRLGTLIKFIPKSITVGFTAGIAITIVVGQIKDFLGLTFPSGVANIETIDKLTNVFSNISTINWLAFLVGGLSVVIMIIWA